MDLLKTLYEVLGSSYPRLSVLAAAAVGALIFGGSWWLIGKQYEKEQGKSGMVVTPEPKRQESLAPPKSPQPPTPESPGTPRIPQARPAETPKVELKPPAISWAFEKELKSKPYGFLGMTRTGKEEARILEFNVTGRNDSDVPITRFSASITSDVTGSSIPVLLNIDGKLFPPEKSKGIPPGARFDLTSPRFPTEGSREGVPASKFIKDFGGFLFVFEYDGERYERRFTAEDIERSARRMEYESM
jgi:hypothetical protein